MELDRGERVDELHLSGWKIIQNKKTFCYGIDAVLLADFAFEGAKHFLEKNRVFDLGTGNGIIPLLLCAANKTAENVSLEITALELQEKIADMARRSVELNGLSEQVQIVQGDIKKAASLFSRGSADFVISNPPYMLPSEGRQSSNQEKMIARQELCCTLRDVVAAGRHLLGDRGHFFMIHRSRRLSEILQVMREAGFNSINYRLVRPFADKESVLCLFDGQLSVQQNIVELPSLTIYKSAGQYTDEVNRIYRR